MPADATRIPMKLRQTGGTMQPITDLPHKIGYKVQREIAEAFANRRELEGGNRPRRSERPPVVSTMRLSRSSGQ